MDRETRQVARYLAAFPKEILDILLTDQSNEVLKQTQERARSILERKKLSDKPKICHLGIKGIFDSLMSPCDKTTYYPRHLIKRMKKERFAHFGTNSEYRNWLSEDPSDVTCKTCLRTKEFKAQTDIL